jgi:predicted RNA-binding Zn ribbon-like protein
MLFAHDTEEGLAAAITLVNTDSTDGDELTDVAALERLIAEVGWTGRFDRTAEELAAVRELRGRLRRIWETDEDGVVEIVNGMLREAHALPQLVRHDDEPFHLHATPRDAPLAARMAVEAAMAFVDVVRAGELDRLCICALPSCRDVMIDMSKSHSKRFCSVGCGNRAAVTAYRARKAAGSR